MILGGGSKVWRVKHLMLTMIHFVLLKKRRQPPFFSANVSALLINPYTYICNKQGTLIFWLLPCDSFHIWKVNIFNFLLNVYTYHARRQILTKKISCCRGHISRKEKSPICEHYMSFDALQVSFFPSKSKQ